MANHPYAPTDTLRVNGDTNTGSFSKALRMTIVENGGRAVVRAMGPHAVNQMCKGLINAQRDLAAQGKQLQYTFGYDTRLEGGNEITAIQAVCTIKDLV